MCVGVLGGGGGGGVKYKSKGLKSNQGGVKYKSKGLKSNLVDKVQLLALDADQPGVYFLAWTQNLLNNACE